MKSKRIISAFLCVLTIAGTLLTAVSCGDSGNLSNDGGISNEKETNNSVPELEAITEEGRESITDGVPPDLKFSGQIFNILSRDEVFDGLVYGIEMGVEEENGDIVNDSIYRRNKKIEDRFDIDINVIKIPGIGGHEGNFNSTVKKSVKAGDHAYDLVAGYAYFFTPLAADGAFLNWNKAPHIDPSAPWWSADLADKMTLDGKLYFMSGDLSLSFIVQMMVIYFNKRMQQDYNTEDFYQTVLDGKWTYDRFYDICKNIYTDVNGDGVKDAGDIYGLTTHFGGNFCDQMFVSQNQPMTQKGGDGYPYLTLNSAKTTKITETIMNLLFENPGVFAVQEAAGTPVHDMFKNGQALFTMGELTYAQVFRDMKDDFGILPFPKFDEAQEQYMGLIQDAYSIFSIPATNDRLDFTGAVTEALAAESYRSVTPAYYETALKIKYSRDDATSRMLDIIRDGTRFDFAFVNSNSMENIIHIFRELSQKKSTDFVSLYEKYEPRYEKALKKLIDKYKELDQ